MNTERTQATVNPEAAQVEAVDVEVEKRARKRKATDETPPEAIEVKCGASKGSFPGIEAFTRAFRPRRTLLVGGDGVPLELFFRTSPADLVAG